MTDACLTTITNALLYHGNTIPPGDLFPTVIPDAAVFVTANPYAFSIGTCLDRGTKGLQMRRMA